jgi:hypothetical protein
VAIKGQHLPTEVCYNAELQSGEDPGEDDEHADELPETVSAHFREVFYFPQHKVHLL